jgi:hypothetical protein
MALPFGTTHYNKRVKNPYKSYTSTHVIRIAADDMQWFSEQMRPGEKTHTTFHRLRMELARLSNDNELCNKRIARAFDAGFLECTGLK